MACRRFPVRLARKRRVADSGMRTVPKSNCAASGPAPVTLSQLLGGSQCGQPEELHICRTSHAPGSMLFTAGQSASGVFIIERGCVKVSMCSGRGRTLIVGFFGPQSVFGLPAAILGFPHESSAEIMKPVTARFVSRDHLMRQIRSADAGFRAAELVSEMLYSTMCELENIWLTDSVEQKLARFLLSLRPPVSGRAGSLHLALDLTHEDIAQRIGVSRESVTRVISRLKKRGVLDLKHSVLSLLDAAALQKLADYSGDRWAADRELPRSPLISAVTSSSFQVASARRIIAAGSKQPS